MSDEIKQCNTCLEVKPLDEFYRAAGTRDGRRGDCKDCNLAAKKARYDADPQREVLRVQRWREENPERFKAYQAEYRSRPERKRAMRNLYYRRTFGITADEVDALLAAQNERCAICGGAPKRIDGWHVDHDHQSGRIRGVLCSRCNHAIGLLDEEPARLRAAAEYLESVSR